MDELACFMDWDLEAIVRGSSIEAPATTIIEDPHPNLSPHHFCSEVQSDDLLFSFPEFSETTRVLDELEELYKPFYPVLHTLSPQTIVTSPLPIPSIEPQEVKAHKPSQKVAPQDYQVPKVSKSKRSKKSLNKRVVKQVTAADIGVCDAWAWRKYGQKPIKGSPYPRSYYRCSSCKGCLARKQVERNHLDPGVFSVTYTAEHNHPHPTRRNSLAGSSRKNSFITTAPPPSTTCDQRTTCSSNSSAASDLSPRTPLVVQSMEDEHVTSAVQQSKGLKEDFVEVFDDAGGGEFGDGWFPTTELDELMGINQQLPLHGSDFMAGFAAT